MIWSAADYRRTVYANVTGGRRASPGNAFTLRDFSCRKFLLLTSAGEQYLLLSAPNRSVQIQCRGDKIGSGVFALEPVVSGFPDVEKQLGLIREAADLCRGRSREPGNRSWPVEATRHRDALVAVDLRRGGFSYRDVALFLYGDMLVRDEWSNPNRTLKNRIIRSFKRGRRMIDGGYKSLLK